MKRSTLRRGTVVAAAAILIAAWLLLRDRAGPDGRREDAPPTFALTKTLPETIIRRGDKTDTETLPAGKTTLLVILDDEAGDWTVKYYGVL